MKHSLQHLQPIFDGLTLGLRRRLGLLLCLSWLVCQTALAQVPDCNTLMACNDGVQVSLDENCLAEITPDIMLEAMQYDNSFYAVEVRDLNGVSLGTTTLDATYIGATLEVRVTLIGCSLSCWGTITIEDKLPPVFTNCPTVTVGCEDRTQPGAPGVTRPTAVDACGAVTYTYGDTTALMPCSDPYSAVIARRWIATDGSGNTDTCWQSIQIRKASLSEVIFPRDYDDIDLPSFSCDNTLTFNPDGTPSPISTGFPQGIECSNIQYYYTDITFDLCGVSQKVVRQWVVIDWCTGAEISDFQTIKIIDDVAPICAGTGESRYVNIDTDPSQCTGTYDVPAPNVTTECSDWTYIVGYKLRDVNGTPFEDPIYDNVITNADGSFTITELPNDTTWIVYTVTDACGNQTMCFTEVVVDDTEAPSPVCEGFTVISLDEIGWADLFAESVDDHSYDNCAIDRFEVRRASTPCGFSEDLTFGEKINFCCADIPNNPIRVTMRVYDVTGNFNDCVVNVTVQDKIAPVIHTCVPDIQLECGQDPFDMTVTGGADLLVATDNCDLTITSRPTGSISNCGEGTIRRIWTVTDQAGRTDQCTQTITVVNTTPFGANDIVWPENMSLDGCNAVGLSPEDIDSKPILSNRDCSLISMSYDDEEFLNTPDVCVKLLRHWVIVNECGGTSQNPALYEYTQKIEINNTVAPVFVSGCNNQQVSPLPGHCEASVTVDVEATDDCAATSIRYAYTIDADNNGSIDINGTTKTFTRVLPAGTHRVTFTATDICGNDATCSFLVSIADDKAPTPICHGEVTWGIDEHGTAEVWASDFNLKSTDDCSDDDLLIYSFNQQGTMPAMTFDCSDLNDGVGTAIDLEMYVIDPDGNFSFCVVTLNLQDNQNHCPDTGSRSAIGGYVRTATGEGIEDIEVDLMNLTDTKEDMDMTEEEGAYMFDAVDYYDRYELAPRKNDDTDNGLSTLDLVLIQRHIIGIKQLEDPTHFVAADINNSKSITGADVVELRKVILGKQIVFNDNTSWRFVDSRHDWDAINYPYDFPEKINLDDLYIQKMDADFTGIKIGDVNNSANVDLEGRAAPMTLYLDNQAYSKGDIVRVDLHAETAQEILGMQMALELDGLTYVGVEGLSADNVSTAGSSMALSIDAAAGMEIGVGSSIVTIVLQATADGTTAESITMSDHGLSAEAYTMNAEVMTIDLQVRGSVISTDEVVLQQNQPNPWGQATSITYRIPSDSDVVLSFYDVSGRLLLQDKSYQVAGLHTMGITKDQLGASGVIYYRLEAAGRSLTKKMILID